MTDLPIPFKASMVRGILREIERPGSGKTQTRRVLAMPDQAFDSIFNDNGVWSIGDAGDDPVRIAKLPVRYRPGDRLYVREAWRVAKALDAFAPRDLDRTTIPEWLASDPELYQGRKRAAMHLPRWASRITLIVTDVRVQRLQDTTEADAISEGIQKSPHGNNDQWLNYPTGSSAAGWTEARESFRTLWDSINARRGFGWDANPWVAAYTFRPVLGNIDSLGEAA